MLDVSEIDADGDGELTADEIYQALAKNDANVSLERIHEIMEKADKDHNGTISQQEYLDAVAEDIAPELALGPARQAGQGPRRGVLRARA